MAPLIGFHSVIDSPLSVSRVIPPTTTIANTSAAARNSRFERLRGRAARAASWVLARAAAESTTSAYSPAAGGGARAQIRRCNVVTSRYFLYIRRGHVAALDANLPAGPDRDGIVRLVPGTLPGDGDPARAARIGWRISGPADHPRGRADDGHGPRLDRAGQRNLRTWLHDAECDRRPRSRRDGRCAEPPRRGQRTDLHGRRGDDPGAWPPTQRDGDRGRILIACRTGWRGLSDWAIHDTARSSTSRR